ncbi:MAG TPA: hypothetical protein VGR07_09155 [Thermoanaerobaculia bacterium]|nr:hypothetical protein [Thermoanaerobaculia bacterium]
MSTNTDPNPDAHPTPQPVPQAKKRKRKPEALADILRDWEALLGAVADHEGALAVVEPHRAALAESLERARQAKALQESHRASRQRETQVLKELRAEGRDRAIRLRGAVRAELGTRTERLVQFGIHPLGRRPLRRRPSETPAPQLELQAGEDGPGGSGEAADRVGAEETPISRGHPEGGGLGLPSRCATFLERWHDESCCGIIEGDERTFCFGHGCRRSSGPPGDPFRDPPPTGDRSRRCPGGDRRGPAPPA